MKANSDKSKQSNKATHRVIAGVLCGASVLSLVLSLVMPPISQAIANDAQEAPTEEPVMGGGSSSESTDVDNTGGDAENQNSDDAKGDETGDGAAEMAPLSDDAETEGAAQPADDSNSDENAIALASVNANKIEGDVTDKFNNGGNYCLTGDAWSSKPINISQNTTIDLACYKLYYSSGNDNTGRTGCTFITISSGATLTVEGAAKDSPVEVPSSEPGQAAKVNWNDSAPQSLTYYVTESTSTPNGLGTSEKTYQHTVTNFGAIVACKEGYVNQVISVGEGCTLNLSGGMITTPRTLGNDGHVIFSQGTVNISGGYVTNGNGGGWGGGLCMAAGSLNMTGGVIAANKAAAGGGIFADGGVTLTLSGGVISGNATYANGIGKCGDDTGSGGYGGGVYTKGADVTIGGSANITNNRVDAYVADPNEHNYGLLGGGGIACTHRGTLTMTGGSVTANYSLEAGGGIYAGFYNQPITFSMTGGTIAGNKSVNAEGGGLRISTHTTGVIGTKPGTSNKVYITNNKTMTGESRGGDWGGGGVFIQKGGRLNVLKSLITDNKAGGWSGGIGACPTGETIVSHSDGAAIYNNTDNVDQDGKHLDTPHYSAGGDGKTEDSDEENYVTPLFQTSGHKDFFLVRNKDGADKTIAVVLGKMLGGGSAGWQGTCDGNPITIDPNGGAEAKYMFGLEAHPTDEAMGKAKTAATTIISGNYSYTHGGGIMTNGDLVVGDAAALDVYPAIKVKANKFLIKDGAKQDLKNHSYQFELLGAPANSSNEPYWNEDGTLNANGCEATSAVTVNEDGEIVIDTAANYQSGNYDLYLVEVPINEEGTTFDKTIYKIHVSVSANPVTTSLLGININRYVVDANTSKVSVKKKNGTEFTDYDGFYSWSTDTADSAVSTVKIGNGSNPAFMNELAPYKTSGTWTPQVTKKVDGGEMKKFKFKLYAENTDNTEKTFQPIYTYTSGSENPQTVKFNPVQIGPLGVDELDSNQQAKFTYYIRECPADGNEGTEHEGYKNDTKTFKVVVTAKDDGKGHLTCTPAYYEVDANGAETKTDTPTFTNTYSTSLPLSGMSGVTLTYLAGAAVLCAAAAWMHIRRKANAKGGERRE